MKSQKEETPDQPDFEKIFKEYWEKQHPTLNKKDFGYEMMKDKERFIPIYKECYMTHVLPLKEELTVRNEIIESYKKQIDNLNQSLSAVKEENKQLREELNNHERYLITATRERDEYLGQLQKEQPINAELLEALKEYHDLFQRMIDNGMVNAAVGSPIRIKAKRVLEKVELKSKGENN